MVRQRGSAGDGVRAPDRPLGAEGRLPGRLAARLQSLDEVSSRMVRGATFTAGSALLGRLTTLVAGVAAARLLGAAQFGTFALCQSTALVASAVGGMGLPWAATRTLAAHRLAGPARTRRLWCVFVLLCLGGVGAVALPVLAAAGTVARVVFGAGADSRLVTASVLVFAGCTVNNLSQAVFMGLERFESAARWSLMRSAACAAGVIGGVVWPGGVLPAVVGYALGESVVLAPMLRHGYLLASRPGQAAVAPARPSSAKDGAQMALAAWGSTLLLQPAFWYVQVLLTHVPGGYASLGVFALAQRAVQAVVMLPGCIAVSSVPILTACWAEGRHDDFVRAARRYAAGYLAYVVPTTFVAVVTAPLTLRAFGEQYVSAWPVFVVLMMAAVPMVLNSLLSSVAVAMNRSRLWMCSDVTQAAALAVAAVLLVPALGGVGASLSFLVGGIATCLALVPVVGELRSRS
ncbi:lipopolysaccharide biosynthesis protein [Actinomadura sp. WMMA1423]|uniref:lipopolysaccharide biosynthesis protein n=1 Tax=Actinomadura sp. WMMA1423 TaxID=2591108 RepID=UPI0011466252|nr:oligosaccharide flippase family protein [Actinomadura sp. WMMA1423]